MTTKEEYYAWCLQKKRNDEWMRRMEKAMIRDRIREAWQIRIRDLQQQLPEQIRGDLDYRDFIEDKVENMEFTYQLEPGPLSMSRRTEQEIKKVYTDIELPLLVLGKPLVMVKVRGNKAITERDIAYRFIGSEYTHPAAETAIAEALEAEGWTG